MKKLIGCLGVIALILGVVVPVQALPFYATTNQIGYEGTVTYTPQGGTEPVIINTSTPRNAYLFFGEDDGAHCDEEGMDCSIFMSSWFDHPPSNVHDSFFQLYDINADTVTSISGGWDKTYTEFTLTITGGNAAYTDNSDTNDWSRAWMPDQNVSARGTWVDYTFTLTASGMTTQIVDGWIENATDPTLIIGNFSGTFVSEERTYSSGLEAFENTYLVDLFFSSELFDQDKFTGEIENDFSAPVPEPATIVLLGISLIFLVGFRKRRH